MMQQAPNPPKKRAAPSPAEDIFKRGRRGAEDYVRKSRVCGGQMVNASYSSPQNLSHHLKVQMGFMYYLIIRSDTVVWLRSFKSTQVSLYYLLLPSMSCV